MTQSEPERRTADGSWMLWTTVGLAGIWLAVLAISVFAPDLVTGSQHEHLPLAAFGTWLWGVVGTVGLLWGAGRLRGSAQRRSLWVGLAVAVVVVWAVAVAVALAAPVFVTGSDPTELPLAALFAPMAAAALTVLASVVTGVFSRGPGSG